MPGTRDHYARVHAPGVRVSVLPVLGAVPLPLALLVAGVGGAQRPSRSRPTGVAHESRAGVVEEDGVHAGLGGGGHAEALRPGVVGDLSRTVAY